MASIIQSTSYKNTHLLVAFIFDLSLLIKILIEDKVFKLKTERNTKKIKFVNFFIYKLTKIVASSPLKEYQYQMQGN